MLLLQYQLCKFIYKKCILLTLRCITAGILSQNTPLFSPFWTSSCNWLSLSSPDSKGDIGTGLRMGMRIGKWRVGIKIEIRMESRMIESGIEMRIKK